MFKKKVTQEEFDKVEDANNSLFAKLASLLGYGLALDGKIVTGLNKEIQPVKQKDFKRLEKKLTALYNHLGLEYFEEETSGVRRKPDFHYRQYPVFVEDDVKPKKKRSKKKKS